MKSVKLISIINFPQSEIQFHRFSITASSAPMFLRNEADKKGADFRRKVAGETPLIRRKGLTLSD